MPFERVIPYVDTFLFDIKAIDEGTHIRCTGASNANILRNIRYVDSLGKSIEIRYPYVPTMNDQEWRAIAEFIRDLKNVTIVRVLPYHNYGEQKYQRLGCSYPLPDVPVPSMAEVEAIAGNMQQIAQYTVVAG